MKILKYNETINNTIPSNDEELLLLIQQIISNEIEMRDVRYTDDVEIDPNSVTSSAENIIIELKKLGVDFNIIFSANKYNL